MTDQTEATLVEAEGKKTPKAPPPTPEELLTALAKKELNAKIVYNKEILKLNTDSLTTGREVSQERLRKLEVLNDFIKKELDERAKAVPAAASGTPASK